MEDQELRKLLEDNLKKNEEIYQLSLQIKKFLLLDNILSVIRILIVVIPVALAIIYLPPFLKDAFSQYQDLLKR